MAQQASTPGPWTITDAGDELEIGKAGAAFPVAYIDGADAEEWADARLIAEAPAMLEALRQLNAEWRDGRAVSHNHMAAAGIRAILARIEGA